LLPVLLLLPLLLLVLVPLLLLLLLLLRPFRFLELSFSLHPSLPRGQLTDARSCCCPACYG
jgi:hypothetical protein